MFSIWSCSSPTKNDKHTTFILKQTSTIFKGRVRIWVQYLIYHCLFVLVWLRFCLSLLFFEIESHSVIQLVLILCNPGWVQIPQSLLPQPTGIIGWASTLVGVQKHNDRVALLRQRIASNSRSSCISSLSAGITGGGHHTQPQPIPNNKSFAGPT